MLPLRLIKGFIPYALIVFLNAFVDLGHKIVIQNTVFKIHDGQTQIILTAVVNALILLPFILLFSPSGFLADKYPKQRVIRYAALAAVAATLLITLCYYRGWFELAFLLTLALAVQSAIYSPAKYGYIKELVGNERLASANGVVQATTISGILLGTFVFSALFETYLKSQPIQEAGQVMTEIAPIGWLLVGLSLLELALSFRLPGKRQTNKLKNFKVFEYVRLTYLRRNLDVIRGRPAIWLSIIGLATFWGISQVLLAAFPAFAKETLNETNTVVIQGILACSGVGIIFGSLIAGRLSRTYIETGLIPVGALGVTVMIAVLPSLDSVPSLGLAFVVLGTMGGLFIIPLNALIQFYAEDDKLGTVLAGNNWIQNVTMLAFLAVTVIFAVFGIDSIGLFYLLTLVAIVGTGYTVRKLPHSFVRIIAASIFKRRYRIDVVGFSHLPASGPVLLLGNHISWIDWALVQIACPRPVAFVMQRGIYQTWYLKPFMKAFGVIPISSGRSVDSLRAVNERLRSGEVVCIFPEGAISRNGHLGKFHTGYERTVEAVEGGVIVPFYLRGLWGSALSRASEGLRKARSAALRRDIIIAFGEPLPIDTSADYLKQKVFELSISAWEAYSNSLDPIPLAWIRTVKRKPRRPCVVDASGLQLTRRQALSAAIVLAGSVRKLDREPNIGLLLPSSAAAALANMAVMLNGQSAVNLNFSAGGDAIRAAIDKADIRTVLSSREFFSRMEGRDIDLQGILSGVNTVFLEDQRKGTRPWRFAAAFAASTLLPAGALYRLTGRPVQLDHPAAILFSSGSEALPKGIVLSHRNIVANCKQISDVLNTHEDDTVIASLPPFHSFGLTVTTLMPMLEGIPFVCHPDPTDAVGIAKAIARYRATILCAPATFLQLYSRNQKVEALMFESLRIVVAGAERLSETVQREFQLKFNKTIYQGYGCTETTPVASVNIPDALDTNYWRVQYGNRPGTVGMPLPGTSFRILDPDTLEEMAFEEDGEIFISGAQVMLGYLNDPERTDRAFVEIDGRRYYRTGDKGHLSEEGFLKITDRYSRFAKIGGEMISLRQVEDRAREALADDELDLLAVNLPDERKGERIVLLVVRAEPGDQLRDRLIGSGFEPLLLPAEVIRVDAIPKLGSGKTDFVSAMALASSPTGA